MSHGGINQFDQRILSRTFAADVLSILSPGLVDGWLRDAVLDPIRDVESQAADAAGDPHLMLAHVLSPHPPFLFDAAGGTPDVEACYGSGCSLLDHRTAGPWAVGSTSTRTCSATRLRS